MSIVKIYFLFQKPTAGTQLPGVKEESPSKISVGEPNDNSTGNILSISLNSLYNTTHYNTPGPVGQSVVSLIADLGVVSDPCYAPFFCGDLS